MVIKTKISDLAKDLGKSNKDIIDIFTEVCGGAAKKPATVDKITKDNSVKNFDSYFKAGEKKQAKNKNQNKEQSKAQNKNQEQSQNKKQNQSKNKNQNQNQGKPVAPKKEKAVTEKDKKRESQAAILQMAEQAALIQELTVLILKSIIRNMRILPLHHQWVIIRKNRN